MASPSGPPGIPNSEGNSLTLEICTSAAKALSEIRMDMRNVILITWTPWSCTVGEYEEPQRTCAVCGKAKGLETRVSQNSMSCKTENTEVQN
jgi:hypothetical protein